MRTLAIACIASLTSQPPPPISWFVRTRACPQPGWNGGSKGSTFGPNASSFRPRELTKTLLHAHWFAGRNPASKQSIASASDLWAWWLASVGAGQGLILNVPPDQTGQVPPRYRSAAKALGDAVRRSFGRTVAGGSLLDTASTDTGAGNVTVQCGASAPGLVLDVPARASAANFNAVRVVEDLYERGDGARQAVAGYRILLRAGGLDVWLDATQLGGTVGFGVVDVLALNGSSTRKLNITQLQWRCTAAAGGARSVRIASIDLYRALPPPSNSSLL